MIPYVLQRHTSNGRVIHSKTVPHKKVLVVCTVYCIALIRDTVCELGVLSIMRPIYHMVDTSNKGDTHRVFSGIQKPRFCLLDEDF